MTARKYINPTKTTKETRHAHVGLSVCARAFTFVVSLLRGNIWIILSSFYYFIPFYYKVNAAKCSNCFLLF